MMNQNIQVYLVAASSLTTELDRFLKKTGLKWIRNESVSDAENVVEAAGRICYMSFSPKQHRRKNSEYIENLLVQGHESVLEHANFTLLVVGVTRALSHQIVRHRVGFSYSQLSQQYHDEAKAEFVMPESVRLSPKLRRQWMQTVRTARITYKAISRDLRQSISRLPLSEKEKQRIVRSAARSVLPNATRTALMITGNARAWRHFLHIRGCTAGDLEMREYCNEVFAVLSKKSPNLFADFSWREDALGKFVERGTRE